MTKVVFETATIADSLKKAARVAPTKGAAFDKAAGIVMDIYPLEMNPVVIRATDIQVFYMEWVDVISADGDSVRWRLPSQLLAAIIGGMPIGSGKEVIFEQEDNLIHISSGRRKARLLTISSEYFPDWDAFDPDTLVSVSNLGGRIEQVVWAASNSGEPPFTGVHISGEELVATDRYKLATAPCKVPVTQPITVPATVFAPFLKQMGETKMAVLENELLIMPDETTQIRTVIFSEKYPQYQRVQKRDHPDHVKLKKTLLVDTISALLALVKVDRFPALFMTFGNEEVTMFMEDKQRGDITDAIEVEGQCVHEECNMIFTPKNLLDALSACPNEDITLGYDRAKAYTILHIDGGSGYESWVIPRKSAKPDGEA